MYAVYLFIDVRGSLFSLSPFNIEHFTTADIYFIQDSIRKKNSELILHTQVGSDIDNSETFT